jgi:hypothetical protein
LSASIAEVIFSRELSLRMPDFATLSTGTRRIRRSLSNATTYISSSMPAILWASMPVIRPTPWEG